MWPPTKVVLRSAFSIQSFFKKLTKLQKLHTVYCKTHSHTKKFAK